MTLMLDHILLGSPDLNTASAAFAEVSGVSPGGGGSHPGFGTRNKLLALGRSLFFEIIAPDPEQTSKGSRASGLEDLAGPRMLTFCMRSTDLASVAARATSAGLSPQPPVAMSRTRADGVTLHWEILYLDPAGWADFVPFVIDWKDSPHPAESSPIGCSLLDFTVLHPKATELRTIYQGLGFDIPVRAAMSPGFVLRLDAPNGEVVLT